MSNSIDREELIKQIKLKKELDRRQARKNITKYTEYVHKGAWIPAKHLTFIHDKATQLLNDELVADNGEIADILLLSMPPQHGKKCSNDTPVLTTNGWKNHGDLKIGDYVFGRNGNPVQITNTLNESIEPDCNLEVEFTDGSKIQVHPQHEWTVYDRSSRKERTVETQYIKSQKYFNKRARFLVDYKTSVEFKEQELPIHPYLLGLWLGDGTTTSPTITHHEDDYMSINKLKILGYEPTSIYDNENDTIIKTRYFGETYQKFKELNFAHNNGDKKYIPEKYKLSSKTQRLELLAGMIDSDGYVNQKTGRVTISNINKQLIDDFEEVCISLGFNTSIHKAIATTSTSGIVGKSDVYQLTFNPDINIPTALDRKETIKIKPRRTRRGIKNIQEVEPKKGKCITVDGGIYLVGKNLVPTHNSQSITETLPSYMAMKHNNFSTIIAGYSSTLAQTFNRRNRMKIEEFGKELFDVEMTKENAGMIELNNGSSIQADGLLGGITGNRADLIIVDDVIKNRQEADSENQRSTIWKEFRDTIRSRLSAKGKVIVIMTRWHEDDLYGRVQNFKELASYSINLPIQAEEDDILGREPGEALFPEIGKDDEWVEKFRRSYVNDPYEGGNRSWNALYMGRPSEREGNILKREYWNRYLWRKEFIDTLPIMILSVDASFKGEEENDKVSIQVWGKKGANAYFVDNVTDQMGFSETKQTIKDMIAKYPRIGARYVEDKANGSAIIEVLNKELGGFIPVKADVSTGGKIARVHAIEPFVRTGNVYIPENVPWALDFINECAEFPHGRYKDQVDAFSQAVNKLMYSYAVNKAEQVGYNDFFGSEPEEEKYTFSMDVDDSYLSYGN